jgi:hypothetical protein
VVRNRGQNSEARIREFESFSSTTWRGNWAKHYSTDRRSPEVAYLRVSVSVDPKRRCPPVICDSPTQKGNAGNLSNQFSQIWAEIGLWETAESKR